MPTACVGGQCRGSPFLSVGGKSTSGGFLHIILYRHDADSAIVTRGFIPQAILQRVFPSPI